MRLIDADSIKIPHFCLATDRIKMMDAINDAPTIEVPTWIPCSERLPEDDGNYLVSGVWSSGRVAVGDCDFNKDDGYFRTAWNFEVIAWMPLPEPYEKGADDE